MHPDASPAFLRLPSATDRGRPAPFGGNVRSSVSTRCAAGIAAATLILLHAASTDAHAASADSPPSTTARDIATDRLVPVHVLHRDGAWRAGKLAMLDDAAFTFRTPDGEERVARDLVVACLVGNALPRDMAFLTQLNAGALVLDDGQLLPGEFRFDGTRAIWLHRWIGSIPIDLDRLSEIRFRAESRAASSSDADTVLLVNGDSISGFVDSLGSEILLEPLEPTQVESMRTDQDSPKSDDGGSERTTPPLDDRRAPRKIPTERIAAVAFAQVRTPAAAGIAMWLADGTHVRASAVEFDGERGWMFGLSDHLLSDAAKPDGSRPLASSPVALVFDPQAIHPLASCAITAIEPPSEGYRYKLEEAVRIEDSGQSLLGLGEIALDGGVRVHFELPAALVAANAPFIFTAEVSIAEPAPADASVEVVARLGDGDVERIRLGPGFRSGVLALAVRGLPATSAAAPRLEIALTDGGDGIAGDRVVLRRAMFLRSR